MKKSILLCSVLFLLVSPASFCADDDESIKALWFKGLEIYEQGEKLEKEQGPEKALPVYEDALKHFKGISIKYPEWNPSFISYRIKVCDRKIAAIRKSIAESEKMLEPASAESLDVRALQNSVKVLRERLAETQKRLDDALLYVSKSQKEMERSAKAIAELEQMARDKSDIEKRYAILFEEIKKIRADSFKESPETKAVIEKLQAELSELNQKYEKTQQENRELAEKYRTLTVAKVDSESTHGTTVEENRNLKKTLEESLESISRMREKLDAATRKSGELAEEVSRLNGIIAEEKRKSDELNEKLGGMSQNSGAITEHLNTENQVVKKELELVKAKLEAEAREKNGLQQQIGEKDNEIRKLKDIAAELGSAAKKYSSDLDTRTSASAETARKNTELAAKVSELEEKNRVLSEEIKAIASKYDSMTKKDKDYTDLAKYCLELEEKNRNNIGEIEKAREEKAQIDKELQANLIRKEAFDKLQGELDNAKITIKNLQDTGAKLEAEKQAMAQDVANAARTRTENEQISKDRDKAVSEKDEILQEKLKLTIEKDRLISEKNTLQAEKEKELTEKNAISEEKGRIVAERDSLRTERDGLISERERVSAEKNDLQSKKDAAAAERDRLAGENERLLSEKADIAIERDRLLLEKEKLLARLGPDEKSPRKSSSGSIEELAAIIEKQKAELLEMQKQKDDAESKLVQQEKKNAASQAEEKLTAKKLLDFGAENAELKRKLKDADTKNAENEKNAKELAGIHVSLKDENKGLRDSVKIMEVKVSSLEKDNLALREAQQAKPAGDSVEKDELARKLLEAQKEIDALKAKDSKNAVQTAPTPAGLPEVERKKLLDEAGNSLSKGDRDSALKSYEKILSLDPGNVEACKGAASIEFEKGGTERAIELYGRALKSAPAGKDVIYGISNACLRKGDYYSSIAYLGLGLSTSPNDPEYLRNMGVACSGLGWNDAAEKLLRKSLEAKPDSKETLFNLAVLLASYGHPKLEEAEKLYRRALELGAAKDQGMESLFKKP